MPMANKAPSLHWLPNDPAWRDQVKAWRNAETPDWDHAVSLAGHRLDFVQTNMLDATVRQRFGQTPPPGLKTKPIRLALLGSATMAHLHPAIRVAALRRGLWVEIYENQYGQYRQELSEPSGALVDFAPNTLLFSFDAYHLTAEFSTALSSTDEAYAYDRVTETTLSSWRLAKDKFHCPILHQAAVPLRPALMGNNEQRLSGSGRKMLSRLNADLRHWADKHGVDLVSVDEQIQRDGLFAWHDPALWHRSKQEVTPAAAPYYGDLVARILAAQQGRSFKCLVLDLDNTLWGGVVGDDGLDGLVLGQGNAAGEGFLAVQSYAKELALRGIILAVCSKNDHANAIEPFERHPEMILRLGDIACFAANWTDKATNIRQIAKELNIGLESLVFLDDNPVERDIVRRELPMVAVPEPPEEPALVPYCLADAGYFEGLTITDEDRSRTRDYQTGIMGPASAHHERWRGMPTGSS